MYCFFLNDTATTEIYTLSLHDALPISLVWQGLVTNDTFHALRAFTRAHPSRRKARRPEMSAFRSRRLAPPSDRKSTRLNSSHSQNSYAVFCLIKKRARHR